MAVKLSDKDLEELDFLILFPDRRAERILFPPDDNIYPADLYGGTWQEGLQAIEDFDWSGSPEGPQTSQDGAASKHRATAAQVTVSQELSAAKVQERTKKGHGSGRSPTPDAPMALRSMPFGRTPPYMAAGSFTLLPRQTNLSTENSLFDRTKATSAVGEAADSLSEPSHGISSLQPESSINQSTETANHAVVAKAVPYSFLAGLQEAAAAASPSMDSEPTSLGTSMATGPTEVVSAGLSWAGTLVGQHLAQASDLPPLPFTANSVTNNSQISGQKAECVPSREVVTPEEGSDLSNLPLQLSLHHAAVGTVIPDVPRDDASASASNAPFTPQSQASVLETVPTAESSIASLELKTSISQKRAKPAAVKESLGKKPAATLFKPDDSSESDGGGYARKKQKTGTLTKARATTGVGNAEAGTTHSATATPKERATKPSNGFLNGLEEDEVYEREEVSTKQMTRSKHNIHGNVVPFTQQMSATLHPASQNPKPLLFQGYFNSEASKSTPENPALLNLSAVSKERLDVSSRIAQGMGQRDRHPFDLGYDKRRTRADTRHEEKREGESASSGAAEGATALGAGEAEQVVIDAEEAPEPKTKRQGRSKAKTKPKPALFYTDAVEEMTSDSEDPLAPTAKAVTRAKKGKAAPTTNRTAAKPQITRAKAPPKTSTPKAPAAPGTLSSNNSILNKYGFKSPSGPRKPRADNAKGKAKKPADDGTEPAQQPRAGKAGRLTRRTSAAQEQVEKEAEKQKNIGLRLRSGGGKK